MKSGYKILFSLGILLFIAFFLGQGIVTCPFIEKDTIENTAGLPADDRSECPNEEEVSFFVQAYADQILHEECHNLTFRSFTLPPVIYYPVWLPPDNA